MHNLQLFRPTYRPTEGDLVRHARRRFADPARRYFTVLQALARRPAPASCPAPGRSCFLPVCLRPCVRVRASLRARMRARAGRADTRDPQVFDSGPLSLGGPPPPTGSACTSLFSRRAAPADRRRAVLVAAGVQADGRGRLTGRDVVLYIIMIWYYIHTVLGYIHNVL